VESAYDPHLSLVRLLMPEGCQELLEIGSPRVHLRLCLTCGLFGCRDSSPLRHGRAHACAIVRSCQPGQDWRWCCAGEAYV
jgi:hypothetical protein